MDYGYLKLKTFYILFIGMGMFCDRCKESSNAKFGCKFILDQKWKIEFAKNMCKGLIHEYQHKGKKQEATI